MAAKVAGLAGAICVSCLLWSKREEIRGLVSSLLEASAILPAIAVDVSRDAFNVCQVPEPSLVSGHTHATAAALRNSATLFARALALHTGSGLFCVEMSKADQRKGLRGCRQWRWAKDVNASNRMDSPNPDDVLLIVDVDYYIDMPNLLARERKPVLLYTSVPAEAAFSGVEDTAVSFDASGVMHTKVAGGGSYSHRVWDYGTDSCLAVSRWCGIPYHAVAYAIERKQVSTHRQVILLSPIREFPGFWAWVACMLLASAEIKRFNPVVQTAMGPFIRFMVHKSDGTYYTTARPGSHLAATVRADDDDAIAAMARLGSTNLMLPTTASWLPKDSRKAAAVLTEYHRAKQGAKVPTVYPVKLGVRGYQYDPKSYDQEARPKLEAFMSPLVHGAFAPVPNKAGEIRCVEGRINGLRQPEPRPNAFRDRCMGEFVELVCGDTILEPTDMEDVAQRQTRPAQKLSLLKAALAGWNLPAVLKNFIKSEAYSDVKDPRCISQYNDSDKLEMATFALVLSNHLKQFRWYGPGMNPLQIAERMVEICAEAEFLNISDFHRMDGTITHVLRGVDRGVCMKLFARHRVVLNELLKRNVDNTGRFPLGTSYEQGPSHGSGCSATSVFQTLRAAFAAYLGFRKAGREVSSAWQSIGIHFGDDGADADLPVDAHEWASKQVGLVLESSVVERGEPGVNFLARYYSPAVWYGSLNSMCDVRRQLSKLHTTVRLPSGVTPEQKLAEKSMGYVATDRNTPVLGQFCTKVCSLQPQQPRKALGVAGWWSKFDDSVQYPNSNDDGWMDSEFDRLFPEFDRAMFDTWLDSVESVEAFLSPPLCANPRPATPTVVPVVVDDDILPKKASSPRGGTNESGGVSKKKINRSRRPASDA